MIVRKGQYFTKQFKEILQSSIESRKNLQLLWINPQLKTKNQTKIQDNLQKTTTTTRKELRQEHLSEKEEEKNPNE